MIIVLEKDGSVVLDEEGNILKRFNIADESIIEENLIEELENDSLYLNKIESMNVI